MAVCEKSVTWDSWHFHRCGKPAKYVLESGNGRIFLCGIHAKKHKGSYGLRKICTTKHAPDVVESTASVSISHASEVSASEADSTSATTPLTQSVNPLPLNKLSSKT